MTNHPVGTKAFSMTSMSTLRQLHYPQPWTSRHSTVSGCSKWAAASAAVSCASRRVARESLALTSRRPRSTCQKLLAEWRIPENCASPTVRPCHMAMAASTSLRAGVIQYTADAAVDSRMPSRAEGGRHSDLHGLQPRVVAQRVIEGDESRSRQGMRRC